MIAVATGAVLSLMFSGISVVMVGAVAVTALARWGWRKAAVATLPAVAVYLLWFQRYGQRALDGPERRYHGGLDDIPRYVVGGLGGTLGEPLGNRHLGSLLLIGLVVVALWHSRTWWRQAPEALALFAGAAMLYVVISQGRGSLPEPATSRYLYLSAGMLLPILVLTAGWVTRRMKWAHLVPVAGAIALCVTGARTAYDNAQEERVRDLPYKGELIAALELADSGVPIISDQPQSGSNPDVTLEELRGLRSRGQLPKWTINERDKRSAQLALQVGSVEGVAPDRPLGGATAAPLPPIEVTPTRAGCASVDTHGANLSLQTIGRAAFTITSPRSVRVLLYIPFTGGYAGPRYVDLVPDVMRTVITDLTGEMVVQVVPAGPTEICGVRWTRG